MRLELSGGRAIALAFDGAAERVVPAATTAMGDVTEFLRQAIIAQFLSGQVLSKQSGALQAAMQGSVENVGGEVIGTVGVDPASKAAVYGAVHEYGGLYTIPEHLRTSSLGNQFSVAAHTADFPERSFLRAALNDQEDQYVSIFLDRFQREVSL